MQVGGVTVLPGDVILGTHTGVIFIPAHLAQEVVETSEDIRVRDDFGKLRLTEGKYTPGEIDVSVWPEQIEADFQAWLAAQRPITDRMTRILRLISPQTSLILKIPVA